jgi:hypothetical protein
MSYLTRYVGCLLFFVSEGAAPLERLNLDRNTIVPALGLGFAFYTTRFTTYHVVSWYMNCRLDRYIFLPATKTLCSTRSPDIVQPAW